MFKRNENKNFNTNSVLERISLNMPPDQFFR